MNKPEIIGTAPVLAVNDVVKSARYYKEILGFEITGYAGDPPVYAMVERDRFQIHFCKSDEKIIKTNEHYNKLACDFIIWVPEIENFFEEIVSRNAEISQGIVKRSYGREFIILDCDGHRILVCD